MRASNASGTRRNGSVSFPVPRSRGGSPRLRRIERGYALVLESLESRELLTGPPPGVTIGVNITGNTLTDVSQLTGRGLAPPDTDGSVGPTQYVEFTNGTLSIFNKSNGSLAVPKVSDTTFWQNAGVPSSVTSAGLSDTRIVYDQASQHWFASEITVSSTNNQVLVAVSNTSDATQGFKSARYTGSPGEFVDYPTLGLNADAVYIGTNNYLGNSSTGVSITSIPKSDLLAATPTVANRTTFRDTSYRMGFTIQGATDFGASNGHGSLVAVDNFAFSKIDRTNVNNPSSPGATLSSTTGVTVQTTSFPFYAYQPDGTRQISALDDRYSANVYKVGNLLYMVHAITFNGRDALRWTILNESSNTVVQEGTISDPNYDIFQGSIAANQYGEAVIGFTRSGTAASDGYLSSYAVAGTTSGGVLSFSAPFLLKAGSANYHLFGGNGERWGDYSATSVDPSNPHSLWTVQEFAQASNNWATQITQLTFGATQPPTLGAIADQTIPAGQSLTIALPGSDPNNLPLTYSAQSQPLAYWLKQSYGLYTDAGGYYTGYRGQGEKYLRGTVSANAYSNAGGDFWYYILPNGDLYEFTPPYSNPSLTGALVARLGTAYYTDPTQLTNATNTAVPATLTVSGNQLTIAPGANASGTFVVIASVSNGTLSASRAFKVVVQGTAAQPPTLGPIADLSSAAGQSQTITLPGSDPNNLPLTYSAQSQPLAYWLKQSYGLYTDAGGYYMGYRGQGEKYLRGTVSANAYSNAGGDFWYYILPNGDLYEFTPPYSNPSPTGALVARLGTAYYSDPTQLTNATNTAVPATLTVSGNQLTIAPAASASGTFVVIASVSNGTFSASRAFKVMVQGTAAQPPTLGPIADLSIAAGQSQTITLQGSDPNNLPLTYSAQSQPLAYLLKQSYGLYTDAGGYYTGYRGQGEKYLRGTVSANGYSSAGGDFWYYLLPNGDLYEFTPPYSNPSLTGALVARLGTAYYSDPTQLTNATNTAVPVTLTVSGNQLTIAPAASASGTFVVIASVSNGTLSASRAFKVTVS